MSSGSHSYYDWQVSTLMLAYDVVEPLSRDDIAAHTKRQQSIDRELHEMAHAVLPKSYLEHPEAEFPPKIVILLTRATLERAVAIVRGL